MSYQVLARKWRPRSFAELIGQDHVRRALVNALDENRVHHAFLFSGTRGVGKTTIARILAKSLNCADGVSAHPCGTCPACREIDEGRFVDLIEVDAASRTKVEDTRELLENVQYAPTRGRYKVYLIDEVHMLSNHSFNALLKTLEEPPPHVKFLLATTDPQRLPVTILSRCLQFNLKRLPVDSISEYLAQVLDKEGIKSEPAALHLIAHAADGSMRDGLSLLDQAIAYGGGQVKSDDVRDMLGSVDHAQVLGLVLALVRHDAAGTLQKIADMAELAVDFVQATEELIGIFHRIALMQFIPEAIDDEPGDQQVISECAHAMTPEDVQLCYQIALTGRRDLELVPSQRSGFEMLLLRMMAFSPVDMTGKHTAGPGTADTATSKAPARGKTTPETAVAVRQPPARTQKQEMIPNWEELVGALRIEGLVRELAANCSLKSVDEQRICLALQPGHVHLCNTKLEKRLEHALQTYYGCPLKLVIDVVDTIPDSTPQQLAQQRFVVRQQAAETDIYGDENVKMMQELFDARIIPDSIHSID